MPLDFRQTVTVTSECTNISFIDDTGNYNSVTNPGGWGFPNYNRAESGGYARLSNVCTGEQIIPIFFPITEDSAPAVYAALGGENNFQWLGFYPTILAYANQDYNTYYDSATEEIPDGLYLMETIIFGGEDLTTIGSQNDYLLVTCSLDCTISQLAYEVLNNPCAESTKKKYEKVLAYRQVMDYLMDCENYSGVCSAWEKINLLLDNKGGCGCGC